NPKERIHTFYSNASFREVVPGVWLPWEFRRVVHRGRSPGEVPDDDLLVLMRARRRLKSLRVNDVAETTFCFQPPPGTAVNDRDRADGDFVTPGGIDLLDNSVWIGRKILRVHSARSPPHEEQGRVVWWVGGILAGVVAGMAAWLAVRRRRGHARARRLSVAPG